MKKFNFFTIEEVTDGSRSSHDALCLVNVRGHVNEIPEFENEDQALDWYKGVWLANQQKVDEYNSKHTKWYDSKMWNYLPRKVYILPEWDIENN